uniref:Dynein light intermediate chain n=1 Tax=Echinostoma caproni TaxID=27848 RepID=A0A183BGI4_9TREM
LVYDLGGLGLRLAPPDDSKLDTSGVENNKSLQSQATAQGLSQLMDFIRRSGDSADERNSKRISSKISAPNVHSAKVNDKTNILVKPKSSDPPNLFEMLQKAEVDFNSKVGSSVELSIFV